MPKNFTFLVATEKDEGKPNHISAIKTHAAFRRNTKYGRTGVARSTPLNRKRLPDHDTDTPHGYSIPEPRAVSRERLVNRSTSDPLVDKPLISKPFLRLPVPISTYEQSTLNFVMDHGRRFSFSEGLTPRYSIAWDWGSRLLENNAMFTICTIVMSETFLLKLYGHQPSNTYYARQAEAYRRMNSMLSDGSTTADDKAIAFIQLLAMDQVLERPKVRHHHCRALNEFLESCGGLTQFLLMPRSERSVLDPWRFTLYLCWGTQYPDTYQRLVARLERFMSRLQLILTWSKEVKISHILQSEADKAHTREVHDYTTYLYHEIWRKGQTHCGADIAAFCFIYIICLSQATYRKVSKFSVTMLKDFADHLRNVVDGDPVRVTDRLHPISALSTLAYIRTDIHNDKEKEVELCQAAVDLMFLRPLISPSTICRLIEFWIDCAFPNTASTGLLTPQSSPDSPSDIGVYDDYEECARGLSSEILSAWVPFDTFVLRDTGDADKTQDR